MWDNIQVHGSSTDGNYRGNKSGMIFYLNLRITNNQILIKNLNGNHWYVT